MTAMKQSAQPAFFIHRPPIGEKTFDHFRLGAQAPVIEALIGYPSWSPAKLGKPFPAPIDQIFHKSFFFGLEKRELSKTTVRLFNDKIERLHRRGLAPEWLPQPRFETVDFPHLVVLALAKGAAATIDLADIAEEIPKFFRWIEDAVEVAVQTIQEDHGVDVPEKTSSLLIAAMTITGLIRHRESAFFQIIQKEEVNSDPAVQFLFDWTVDGIGEQNLKRAAERALNRYGLLDEEGFHAAGFLHPALLKEAMEAWDEIVKLAFGNKESKEPEPTLTPAQVEERAPARHPIILPEAVGAPSRSAPPATPEGVVLASRAVKEVRRERRIAEDRLADGLALLGEYRRMRLGEISLEEYFEAVRSRHFDDSPCFANGGSLKAFADDYSVMVGGVRHILDRHLKWGKGNNAYSAIRIYYAWDAANGRVIVGSAPRHLPISSY